MNWWQSIVRVIDITNPDGTMNDYQSIRTAGRVPDKFKLNWDGSIFTSISEDWRSTVTRRLTTMLETFRLPDPRSLGPAGVIKLGELELGRGEQLHATRFDGDRAYVVTFFRIDPLWVVDLSDPSAPRIAGSVDVPGWSTFIQPLGSRLVSIGVETNRVAVSLFDVSNPSAPALLSRVRLGQNYSYSEANWDEKAFSVLPDAGLILVPFSGDTTNGYASNVQLVDLNANSLTARGIIEHQFQPRRATVYTDRILSISNWELLSVDASDRDHPLLRGSTTLAWPVDRVFLYGNYLVELGAAGGWGFDLSTPVVRVTAAAAPEQVINQSTLTSLPVLGATKRGSHLYVVQGQSWWYYPGIPVIDVDGNPIDSSRSQLLLTVIDLDALPAVQISGRVEANVKGFAISGELEAVWPRDLLVWSGGGFNWWRCFYCPMPLAGDAMVGPIRWWPRYWGGGGGQLIAFDVSHSDAPRFASAVNLASDNWWSFSKPFAADGKVYLSHQTSEIVEKPLADDAVGPAGAIIYPPIGTWITRSHLDVVDYADADEPLVRKPVNIPGTLAGLSHEGAVLYTTGTHWTTNTETAWTEYLDASAYDGVSAHLIDSLPLPATWPRPLLVSGANIFLGRAGPASYDPVIGPIVPFGADLNATAGSGVLNDVLPALETWNLSAAGKFQRAGSVTLNSSASSLAAFDALLAVQQNDNSVTLFDASNGAALRRVGGGQPGGCFWFDLTRADGELGRGLWLPLGTYGVAKIPAAP
jgi:hypothetical protein